MPEPIKGNLNFEVCHSIYHANHSMNSMMACLDYYEIGMTLSGKRKIIMEDRIFYLQPGIVATTPMGAYHRSSSASNVTYERIMIKYKPVLAKEFIDLIGQDSFDALHYEYLHVFSEEHKKQILDLLYQMNNIYTSYNEYSELLFKGLLHQLLYIMYRYRIPAPTENFLLFKGTNALISDALHIMESNITKPPSLSEVARRCNVSREHLSREFMHIIGVPFSEYRNQIRLRQATELLENTDYSVEKISELSGFSNSNYMSDVFRKKLSMSPRDYRKIHKKN